MQTMISGREAPPVAAGFEAVQEFQHECGLVEGIGYWNGQLVRYTTGGSGASPFECQVISLAEALRWWAELQTDENADSAFWVADARARFLRSVADRVAL